MRRTRPRQGATAILRTSIFHSPGENSGAEGGRNQRSELLGTETLSGLPVRDPRPRHERKLSCACHQFANFSCLKYPRRALSPRVVQVSILSSEKGQGSSRHIFLP